MSALLGGPAAALRTRLMSRTSTSSGAAGVERDGGENGIGNSGGLGGGSSGAASPALLDTSHLHKLQRAGWLSRCFLNWASGLVHIAYRREVRAEELWLVPDNARAGVKAEVLGRLLSEELSSRGARDARLWRAILRGWWPHVAWSLVLATLWLVFVMLTNALLLAELLRLLTNVSQGLEPTVACGSLEVPVRGLYLVLGFFLGELLRSVCVNQHWEIACMGGMSLRGAVCSLLFRKLTRVRRCNESLGTLLNIVSSDVDRLRDALSYGQFLVITPMTLLATIGLGYWLVGPAVLAGFVVLVLSVPLQAYIARLSGRLRAESVAITDRRVQLMNEILKAAQLIKLYAWERSFFDKVQRVRSDELVKVRQSAYTKALNAAVGQAVPALCSSVTFLVHTLALEGELGVAQVFSLLAIFNVSRFPLTVLPVAVRFCAEFFVAARRVQEFFMLEEIVPHESTEQQQHIDLALNEPALEMRDARFAWAGKGEGQDESEEGEQAGLLASGKGASAAGQGTTAAVSAKAATAAAPPLLLTSSSSPPPPPPSALGVLAVDELRVARGSLTAVVGKVGSGKSSFLHAVLGDMRLTGGRSVVRGRLAYVGQQPWVFNATVRENITLGAGAGDGDGLEQPEQQVQIEQRLRRAIQVCALESDLLQLPAGLETEIGERGINMSGGQKVRLALARAVFFDADTYLLDDVLSAVDVHVAEHIWTHCIRGALSGKTVVLATHALQYLAQCDQLLVLDGMRLQPAAVAAVVDAQAAAADAGTLAGAAHKDDVAALGGATVTQHAVPVPVPVPMTAAPVAAVPLAPVSLAPIPLAPVLLAPAPLAPAPLANANANADADTKAYTAAGSSRGPAQLMSREERQEGAVSWETVRAFASQAGGCGPVSLVICLLFFAEALSYLSMAWLTLWTADRLSQPTWAYETVFFALAVLISVTYTMRGVYFAKRGLLASQALHDQAFLAVMSAKISFLQTTPLGRILARFSSDVDKIDVMLVEIADQALSLLTRCLLGLVLICVVLPAFLLGVVPLGYTYVRMLNFTRRVVRQMKRIDNISRSPLISRFQSFGQGLSSARAFGLLGQAVQRTDAAVDETTRAYQAFFLSSRWVAVRVDFVTTFIVSFTALLCVLFAGTISPGIAGLVLTSALQMAGIFQYATRQLAELEAQLTSVERLRHFMLSTPRELQVAQPPPATLPDSWPARGAIEFRNYSTRYRAGLPLVLDGLSLHVAPGSRTALVGRTGSGKSSTLLALFRLIEADGGQILIDGVDIAKVPLSTLRADVLSIVPQDASLFRNTLRYNLDPFGTHSDQELWAVLEQVQLGPFARSLGVSSSPTRQAQPQAALHEADSFNELAPARDESCATGLDYMLEEGGQNLSTGQRQLVCFARALLRPTKIICLDEAMANVDEKSDVLVRAALERACQGRTLIVIAHRLSTVAGFDAIVVLDHGRVVEQGRPDQLARLPGGAFAAMLHTYEREQAQAGAGDGDGESTARGGDTQRHNDGK